MSHSIDSTQSITSQSSPFVTITKLGAIVAFQLLCLGILYYTLPIGYLVNLTNSSSIVPIYVVTECCGFGHRLEQSALSYVEAVANDSALLIIWPMRGVECYAKSPNSNFKSQKVTDLFRRTFNFKDIGVELQQRQHVQSGDILSLHPSYAFDWLEANELKKTLKAKANNTRVLLDSNITINPYERVWEDRMISDTIYREFFLKIAENMNGKINNMVQGFRDEHDLSSCNLITIHVRQGNNETGDFTDKHRANDVASLAQITYQQIETVVNSTVIKNNEHKKWKVFVATDNRKITEELQRISKYEVISRQQVRPQNGVWFGEFNHDIPTGNCVDIAIDSLVDMKLLSYGKVLLVPVYSTFNWLPQIVVTERSDIVCGIFSDNQWKCTNGSVHEFKL
eukprot:13145_1